MYRNWMLWFQLQNWSYTTLHWLALAETRKFKTQLKRDADSNKVCESIPQGAVKIFVFGWHRDEKTTYHFRTFTPEKSHVHSEQIFYHFVLSWHTLTKPSTQKFKWLMPKKGRHQRLTTAKILSPEPLNLSQMKTHLALQVLDCLECEAGSVAPNKSRKTFE